jgi:nucleoside-diphosphate-sugar epimerase
MKRRMVIFGCGYVGTALARIVLDKGWDLVCLSRNRQRLESIKGLPEDARVAASLETDEWHASVSGDFDYAVNLVSSAGGGLDGYRISYLEGNRSILRWAQGRSIGQFLYTSATSVYPQFDGAWVSESDVPDDLETLSPSGRILKEAESIVLSGADVSRIERVAVLRLAGIYGPGRSLYLNRMREGGLTLPGSGEEYLNLIHRDDVVSAILAVLAAEVEGIFNVADGEPAKKQEIVAWLAEQLSVEVPTFDPELNAGRSQRRRVGGHLPNRRVAAQSIQKATGWQPRFRSFREGYKALLA